MTIRSVLMKLAAVFIVICIAIYAYYSFRDYQVSRFETRLRTLTASGLSQALSLVKEAPDVKCVSTGSNFTTAASATLYHSGDRTRIDIVFAGVDARELHEMLDGSDMYVWTSESDEVGHVEVDLSIPPLPEEAGTGDIFSSIECTPWLRNEAAFSLPGKPIVEL